MFVSPLFLSPPQYKVLRINFCSSLYTTDLVSVSEAGATTAYEETQLHKSFLAVRPMKLKNIDVPRNHYWWLWYIDIFSLCGINVLDGGRKDENILPRPWGETILITIMNNKKTELLTCWDIFSYFQSVGKGSLWHLGCSKKLSNLNLFFSLPYMYTVSTITIIGKHGRSPRI